jgi:hypothetical protein
MQITTYNQSSIIVTLFIQPKRKNEKNIYNGKRVGILYVGGKMYENEINEKHNEKNCPPTLSPCQKKVVKMNTDLSK